MQSRSKKYDLAVAYRICPHVSQAAIGLPFSEDKYQISELCLRSFVDSLGSLRIKMWAVLDGCPPKYEELFHRYVAAEDLVILHFDRIGNAATFIKQVDILLNQTDSDVVYFAEDDYFYLQNGLASMLQCLTEGKDVDFISPYDHLDSYILPLHKSREWIKVSASHHWRTTASTCLTFLTRQQTLAQCEAVFRSYANGNDDCSIWLSLTKYRVFDPFAFGQYAIHRLVGWTKVPKAWLYCWRQILFGRKRALWVPIPGIATHMNRDLLSPSVDWCELMQPRRFEESPFR
jgi:hypothetical protein